MADEPQVPVAKKPRVRKPAKDERIISPVQIEKAVMPPELQGDFLAWYEKHSVKERELIAESYQKLIEYARNGCGYRLFFATFRQWVSRGTVGAKKGNARF